MLIRGQPDKPLSITFKNFCIDDGISVRWWSLTFVHDEVSVYNTCQFGIQAAFLYNLSFITSFCKTDAGQWHYLCLCKKILKYIYIHAYICVFSAWFSAHAGILVMLRFSVVPTEVMLFFLLLYSQNGTVSCLNAPLGHHYLPVALAVTKQKLNKSHRKNAFDCGTPFQILHSLR